MRIKLDKNMPSALIDVLYSAGHDVTTAHQEKLSGAVDPIVLHAAAQEIRLLMTFDVGFGDIRSYPPGSHAGIVVFRLKDQRWSVLEEPAKRLISSGIIDRLRGGLAVVDENRIRIRYEKR
jgi:predicted nuclease of predicted toxin-antitoxin system